MPVARSSDVAAVTRKPPARTGLLDRAEVQAGSGAVDRADCEARTQRLPRNAPRKELATNASPAPHVPHARNRHRIERLAPLGGRRDRAALAQRHSAQAAPRVTRSRAASPRIALAERLVRDECDVEAVEPLGHRVGGEVVGDADARGA